MERPFNGSPPQTLAAVTVTESGESRMGILPLLTRLASFVGTSNVFKRPTPKTHTANGLENCGSGLAWHVSWELE
jgi:hypothetical protein